MVMKVVLFSSEGRGKREAHPPQNFLQSPGLRTDTETDTGVVLLCCGAVNS